MPLDQAHVTAASRRMLPTYPAFFGIVGLGLLLTPIGRLTQTPVFRFVDGFVSVRLWGCGFLALAVVFVLALIRQRRRDYKWALSIAVVWMTLWSLITFVSAFSDLSSFTAWAWSAFIARACWASLVSLETGEV